MKLNSNLFDSIRVKPNKKRRSTSTTDHPPCEWQGCERKGSHKAPKGRSREGQYYHFCIDHVRQYNKNYNYFSGMDDDSIATYQKASMTGHRPTWTMGVNKNGQNGDAASATDQSNPFGPFGERSQAQTEENEHQRHVGRLARRHFGVLDLDINTSGELIKARYKELVKRLHPDANGGDRSTEEQLQEVIQAYNYLKSSGFC